MKKQWAFLEKIVSGQKTIESRWYQHARIPWNAIKAGDIIYFKNTGESVSVKAKAQKVLQFADLDQITVKEILYKYGKRIGIEDKDVPEFFQKFRDKKYCMLIFLESPQKIKPFNINKKGFGAMASWLMVKNIKEIEV